MNTEYTLPVGPLDVATHVAEMRRQAHAIIGAPDYDIDSPAYHMAELFMLLDECLTSDRASFADYPDDPQWRVNGASVWA